MVKGMKSFVNDKIREVQGSFEEKRQYTIRRYQANGTTVKTKVFYSDEKDRYLHIYYSYSKAASEREDLESKIDRIAAYLKKQEGQPVIIDKSYGIWLNCHIRWNANRKTGKGSNWSVT